MLQPTLLSATLSQRHLISQCGARVVSARHVRVRRASPHGVPNDRQNAAPDLA